MRRRRQVRAESDGPGPPDKAHGARSDAAPDHPTRSRTTRAFPECRRWPDPASAAHRYPRYAPAIRRRAPARRNSLPALRQVNRNAAVQSERERSGPGKAPRGSLERGTGERRRSLGGHRSDPAPHPVTLPRRENGIGIFGSAEATVVASERTEDVAVLLVEIATQDEAAITKVRAQAEQIVLRVSDELHPERHHLHVAASARDRNRVFAKVAFVLNEPEDQLRIEPGACGFVLHRDQKITSSGPIRYARRKAPRHLREPRVGLARGREQQMRRGIIRDRSMQRCLHARRQRFLHLHASPGACAHERQRSRHAYDAEQADAATSHHQVTSRSLRKLPIESTATTVE